MRLETPVHPAPGTIFFSFSLVTDLPSAYASSNLAGLNRPLSTAERRSQARRVAVRELLGKKVLEHVHHIGRPHKEGDPLVQLSWPNVQDALTRARNGLTTGLFGEKGDRIALVQQAQLAVGVPAGARVHVDTAGDQIAVEV